MSEKDLEEFLKSESKRGFKKFILWIILMKTISATIIFGMFFMFQKIFEAIT